MNIHSFFLLLMITVFLTGCQTSTKRDEQPGQTSDIKFSDSTRVNKDTIEAYIHSQPDADLTYNYTVVTEKDDKKARDEKDQTSVDRPYIKRQHSSDIWKRVRAGFRLKLVNHPRVEAEIRWFINHPDYLERIYDRAEPLLHYILNEVEKRGIPTEIALLPVVESAFQPFAYSHAAASGLWQFIPATGKRYGMRQDWWYDGRRDIIASTKGSLAYLQKLHRQFNGDWLLALASYNTGEGRVAREVRRNRRRGRRATFWHLRLPRETRAYVPKLLAIRAIIQNAKKYGLSLRSIPDEPKIAEVNVGSQIDLAIAAQLAGISLEELYKLNPGFNRWATSPRGPHRLLVPVDVADEFRRRLRQLPRNRRMLWKQHKVARGETIYSIARKYKVTPTLLARVNNLRRKRVRRGKTLKVPESYIARAKYTLTLTQRYKGKSYSYLPNRRRIRYRVRRGDTLYRVARRYRVSTRSLARWNRISRRSRLRRGQRLTVYIKHRRYRYRRYKRSRKYRHRRSHRRRGRTRRIRYRVRRGDTLSRISRRYGVSIRQIKRWNRRLRRGRYIYPGLRLTLYIRRR